ncbi:hypothetical protein IGI37_002528 [Enterococcus sp. AZ194]|uniref:C39 family peptidase n=1 Tax=Enterococcus sp. AZ194 TaxID=2774629 RepID=UPI003F268951
MRKVNPRRPYKKRKKKSPIILLFVLLLLVGGVWALANTDNPLSIHSFQTIFHSEQTQQSFGKQANDYLKKQKTIAQTQPYPLNLQKDERWGDTPYGDDTLGVNGCAIATLSMILSREQGRTVEPPEILDWAQDAYFVEGAGTSWNIFEDFATHYGLPFKNLGSDINTALTYLEQGIPVVVSVSPGEFTDTGHIMLLSAYKDGQLSVYDPNDTPEKNHYKKTYDVDEVASQVINYWVYA